MSKAARTATAEHESGARAALRPRHGSKARRGRGGVAAAKFSTACEAGDGRQRADTTECSAAIHYALAPSAFARCPCASSSAADGGGVSQPCKWLSARSVSAWMSAGESFNAGM